MTREEQHPYNERKDKKIAEGICPKCGAVLMREHNILVVAPALTKCITKSTLRPKEVKIVADDKGSVYCLACHFNTCSIDKRIFSTR